MLQKKILRLAKILNRFTLDNISTILELNEQDEKTALEYLSVIAKKGFIKKTRNKQYLYLDKKTKTPVKQAKPLKKIENTKPEPVFDTTRVSPKIIDITKDKSYKIYLNAKGRTREQADKYLAVLQASGGLSGAKLRFFINQWNEKFPDKKTSYQSVMRARKSLMHEGITSLLAKYGNNSKSKSSVDDYLYEYFKEYYLLFGVIPTSWAIELAMEKFMQLHPEKEHKQPSYLSFRRRLLKEFTREQIKQFRTVKIKGGQ